MGLKKSLTFDNLDERVDSYERHGGDAGIANAIRASMKHGMVEIFS